MKSQNWTAFAWGVRPAWSVRGVLDVGTGTGLSPSCWRSGSTRRPGYIDRFRHVFQTRENATSRNRAAPTGYKSIKPPFSEYITMADEKYQITWLDLIAHPILLIHLKCPFYNNLARHTDSLSLSQLCMIAQTVNIEGNISGASPSISGL